MSRALSIAGTMPPASLIEDLARAIADTPREDLPPILAQLEGIRAAAWLRLAVPPPPEPGDRLLSASEAAEMLGFKRADGSPDPSALYRKSWPFTVRVSSARTRYSERGLQAFIRSRRGR